MGGKFLYKGLETVERGEGYAFKQNYRHIVLKLQLMQMCTKKRKLVADIVVVGKFINSPVCSSCRRAGRAVKYNGKDDLNMAKGG
jgi:hypothetical protein